MENLNLTIGKKQEHNKQEICNVEINAESNRNNSFLNNQTFFTIKNRNFNMNKHCSEFLKQFDKDQTLNMKAENEAIFDINLYIKRDQVYQDTVAFMQKYDQNNISKLYKQTQGFVNCVKEYNFNQMYSQIQQPEKYIFGYFAELDLFYNQDKNRLILYSNCIQSQQLYEEFINEQNYLVPQELIFDSDITVVQYGSSSTTLFPELQETEILIVATRQKIIFFQILRSKQIEFIEIQYNYLLQINQQITQILFTSQGRIFIGDNFGNVHELKLSNPTIILGIPNIFSNSQQIKNFQAKDKSQFRLFNEFDKYFNKKLKSIAKIKKLEAFFPVSQLIEDPQRQIIYSFQKFYESISWQIEIFIYSKNFEKIGTIREYDLKNSLQEFYNENECQKNALETIKIFPIQIFQSLKFHLMLLQKNGLRIFIQFRTDSQNQQIIQIAKGNKFQIENIYMKECCDTKNFNQKRQIEDYQFSFNDLFQQQQPNFISYESQDIKKISNSYYNNTAFILGREVYSNDNYLGSKQSLRLNSRKQYLQIEFYQFNIAEIINIQENFSFKKQFNLEEITQLPWQDINESNYFFLQIPYSQLIQLFNNKLKFPLHILISFLNLNYNRKINYRRHELCKRNLPSNIQSCINFQCTESNFCNDVSQLNEYERQVFLPPEHFLLFFQSGFKIFMRQRPIDLLYLVLTLTDYLIQNKFKEHSYFANLNIQLKKNCPFENIQSNLDIFQGYGFIYQFFQNFGIRQTCSMLVQMLSQTSDQYYIGSKPLNQLKYLITQMNQFLKNEEQQHQEQINQKFYRNGLNSNLINIIKQILQFAAQIECKQLNEMTEDQQKFDGIFGKFSINVVLNCNNARFQGTILYFSRLLRIIWQEPILKCDVKIDNPTNDWIPQFSQEELQFLIQNIIQLYEVIQEWKIKPGHLKKKNQFNPFLFRQADNNFYYDNNRNLQEFILFDNDNKDQDCINYLLLFIKKILQCLKFLKENFCLNRDQNDEILNYYLNCIIEKLAENQQQQFKLLSLCDLAQYCGNYQDNNVQQLVINFVIFKCQFLMKEQNLNYSKEEEYFNYITENYNLLFNKRDIEYVNSLKFLNTAYELQSSYNQFCSEKEFLTEQNKQSKHEQELDYDQNINLYFSKGHSILYQIGLFLSREKLQNVLRIYFNLKQEVLLIAIIINKIQLLNYIQEELQVKIIRQLSMTDECRKQNFYSFNPHNVLTVQNIKQQKNFAIFNLECYLEQVINSLQITNDFLIYILNFIQIGIQILKQQDQQNITNDQFLMFLLSQDIQNLEEVQTKIFVYILEQQSKQENIVQIIVEFLVGQSFINFSNLIYPYLSDQILQHLNSLISFSQDPFSREQYLFKKYEFMFYIRNDKNSSFEILQKIVNLLQNQLKINENDFYCCKQIITRIKNYVQIGIQYNFQINEHNPKILQIFQEFIGIQEILLIQDYLNGFLNIQLSYLERILQFKGQLKLQKLTSVEKKIQQIKQLQLQIQINIVNNEEELLQQLQDYHLDAEYKFIKEFIQKDENFNQSQKINLLQNLIIYLVKKIYDNNYQLDIQNLLFFQNVFIYLEELFLYLLQIKSVWFKDIIILTQFIKILSESLIMIENQAYLSKMKEISKLSITINQKTYQLGYAWVLIIDKPIQINLDIILISYCSIIQSYWNLLSQHNRKTLVQIICLKEKIISPCLELLYSIQYLMDKCLTFLKNNKDQDQNNLLFFQYFDIIKQVLMDLEEKIKGMSSFMQFLSSKDIKFLQKKFYEIQQIFSKNEKTIIDGIYNLNLQVPLQQRELIDSNTFQNIVKNLNQSLEQDMKEKNYEFI